MMVYTAYSTKGSPRHSFTTTDVIEQQMKCEKSKNAGDLFAPIVIGMVYVLHVRYDGYFCFGNYRMDLGDCIVQYMNILCVLKNIYDMNTMFFVIKHKLINHSGTSPLTVYRSLSLSNPHKQHHLHHYHHSLQIHIPIFFRLISITLPI